MTSSIPFKTSFSLRSVSTACFISTSNRTSPFKNMCDILFGTASRSFCLSSTSRAWVNEPISALTAATASLRALLVLITSALAFLMRLSTALDFFSRLSIIAGRSLNILPSTSFICSAIPSVSFFNFDTRCSARLSLSRINISFCASRSATSAAILAFFFIIFFSASLFNAIGG